jgi:hypothetical protein
MMVADTKETLTACAVEIRATADAVVDAVMKADLKTARELLLKIDQDSQRLSYRCLKVLTNE